MPEPLEGGKAGGIRIVSLAPWRPGQRRSLRQPGCDGTVFQA